MSDATILWEYVEAEKAVFTTLKNSETNALFQMNTLSLIKKYSQIH